MTKLRELYGDQLASPEIVLQLVLALAPRLFEPEEQLARAG